MLKALAILSDATVRRSVIDREDVNHTGNQEKDHFSFSGQQSCNLKFFSKTLLIRQRRRTGQ